MTYEQLRARREGLRMQGSQVWEASTNYEIGDRAYSAVYSCSSSLGFITRRSS